MICACRYFIVVAFLLGHTNYYSKKSIFAIDYFIIDRTQKQLLLSDQLKWCITKEQRKCSFYCKNVIKENVFWF